MQSAWVKNGCASVMDECLGRPTTATTAQNEEKLQNI
jgi:hypothetical protein